MPSTGRVILHVDIDAFYASVEAKENPSLRGLPLVVGADPEGGMGRGVVVACSYEARRFGVKSGMPISRAYKLCPQATYIEPNFALYGRISGRIMDLLRKFSDEIEQVGIDEAFLDATRRVKNLEDGRDLAHRIKKALLDAEGLTCSIGIAPNKSSAKIASDMQKPDGLMVVPSDGVAQFLSPLPVSVIPGVGKKTRIFLKQQGIETISQLQQVPGKQLVKWFGKGGVWLWGVIHGQEQIEVKERSMPKSLSVERTFKHDIGDFQEIRLAATELGEELLRRLKLANLQFKTIGIKIRFRGFETHTRERSLIDYSDSQAALHGAVESLLEEFGKPGRLFRLVGVKVSQLRRIEVKPASLERWLS